MEIPKYAAPFALVDMRGRERVCVLVGDFRHVVTALHRQARSQGTIRELAEDVCKWRRGDNAGRVNKATPCFEQLSALPLGETLRMWAASQRIDLLGEVLDELAGVIYPVRWPTSAGELLIAPIEGGETADLVCRGCRGSWRIQGRRDLGVEMPETCPRCAPLVLEVVDA